MKFMYSVKSNTYSYAEEHSFEGYDYTREMAEDFRKVVKYHELQYEDIKRRYIEKWGEEQWNSKVEYEKKYDR